VPTFKVKEQDLAWVPTAPVVLKDTFSLAATPQQVFDVLADLRGWSNWYGGMKKVRIDGTDTGVGATRTVWIGTTRVAERFIEWRPGERVTFAIIGSNTPGLGSMVEDWAVAADPADANRSVLTATIGIQPSGLLRPLPGLVRGIMRQATKGATGIASNFG
jgi:uncharacterized protein YndB with AHSA1/START domain